MVGGLLLDKRQRSGLRGTHSTQVPLMRAALLTRQFSLLNTAENVKGIPEFWLAVLLKCEVTMDIVKDKDMDVLKYLRDVQVGEIVADRLCKTSGRGRLRTAACTV